VLKLHEGPYRVAATGSLVTKVPYYFSQVEGRLQKRHPGAQLVLPRFAPGVGAALIALQQIDVEWTEELFARTDATAVKPT